MPLSEKWITDSQTLRMIDTIRERMVAGEDSNKIVASLRRELTTERATFILAQAELQLRARKKFSRADSMLFTKLGLEQATSEPIAIFKQSCLPKTQAVLDICCGIGGDAIGFSNFPRLTVVDQDETTLAYAKHNLQIYGAGEPEFTALAESFADTSIPSGAFVHIDPDRRTSGRTVRAENFSPDLDTILRRLSPEQAACIKLAPATRLETHIARPHQRHWIGHQRECKQQLLWLSPEMESQAGNRITVIDREGAATNLEIAEVHERRIVSPIGQYLYEPHAAVLAADLVDSVAKRFQLGRLSVGSVYLTGEAIDPSPFLSGFRLIEQCSMKAKKIQAALQAHDVGVVEWKNRGVDAAAVARVRKIRTEGSKNATVILTRMGKQFVSLICERLG